MEKKILSYLYFWCSAKNTKYKYDKFKIFYHGQELRFDCIDCLTKAIKYLVSKNQFFSVVVKDN